MDNPMLSLKLALLLGLSLVATLVHAQDLHDEKGNAVHILTREELKKIAKERSDARDEAVAAEKRGDYAAAEAAYRRICTLMGRDESFEHIWLARLFDKTTDEPTPSTELSWLGPTARTRPTSATR